MAVVGWPGPSVPRAQRARRRGGRRPWRRRSRHRPRWPPRQRLARHGRRALGLAGGRRRGGPGAGSYGGRGRANRRRRTLRGHDRALLGGGDRALLQLGRALGRATRPLTQALDLARLGEIEQGQHGKPEDRREAGVGAVLVDLVGDREGQNRRHAGRHARERLGPSPPCPRPARSQPTVRPRSSESSETFAASAAASPSKTRRPTSSNMVSTVRTSKRSRSARRILSAGVGCVRS